MVGGLVVGGFCGANASVVVACCLLYAYGSVVFCLGGPYVVLLVCLAGDVVVYVE